MERTVQPHLEGNLRVICKKLLEYASGVETQHMIMDRPGMVNNLISYFSCGDYDVVKTTVKVFYLLSTNIAFRKELSEYRELEDKMQSLVNDDDLVISQHAEKFMYNMKKYYTHNIVNVVSDFVDDPYSVLKTYTFNVHGLHDSEVCSKLYGSILKLRGVRSITFDAEEDKMVVMVKESKDNTTKFEIHNCIVSAVYESDEISDCSIDIDEVEEEEEEKMKREEERLKRSLVSKERFALEDRIEDKRKQQQLKKKQQEAGGFLSKLSNFLVSWW